MRCLLPLLLFCLIFLPACQTVYYSAWEKVGVHKRDILVDRVEDARDAQSDAQEQFKDAFEEFSALINFDGGDLQSMYDRLSDEYEDSKESAEELSERIDKVESVAKALFSEWKTELDQYSNSSLRADSARKLKETQVKYSELIRTMRIAEKKVPPVLSVFNDNVLYLKHNLNARAIGTLKAEFSKIKSDIDVLIEEMNRSIKTSNDFIKTLKQ